MSLDAVIETLGEEVLGNLCGLPPGTVTLASSLIAGTSGTDDTSPQQQASSAVRQNSSGLTKKEKKIASIAINRLAVQLKRDHPRASKRKCVQTALNILHLNNKLYSESIASRNFEIALKGGPKQRRSIMIKILRDGRHYI